VVAEGADLLIAEAYQRDRNVPHHPRLADLDAHRGELTARRIVLTAQLARSRRPRGVGRNPADSSARASGES